MHSKSKVRQKPYDKFKRIFSSQTIAESESEKEGDLTTVSEISKSVSNNLNHHSDTPIVSNLLDQPINSTMATASNDTNNSIVNVVTPTDIYNSLRVPDAIKDLPKFDGNPRLLFEFLNNVEEIRSLIVCTEGTPYGQLLLRAIRNKIEGPANEVLNMYGTPLDWFQIKQNLILHYSDKRNETSLIKDLHEIRQNNKPVERFYSEIIEILATMTNHIQIHEKDPNVIKAKRDLYTEMCLSVFLSGLKEPLGSTVKAMKPESLATAFSYCIKEQNISYSRCSHLLPKSPLTIKSNNTQSTVTKSSFPSSLFPKPPQLNIGYTNPIQNRLPFSLPTNRPVNPYYSAQHQIKPFSSTFYNSAPMPRLTQNPNFRMPSQNNQLNPNPFNTNTNKGLSKPEPMDIDSIRTRQNRYQSAQQNMSTQNNFFRSTGPPKFTSKELFHLSSSHDSEQNLNNNYQQLDQYYDDQITSQSYTDEAGHAQNIAPDDETQECEIDDSNFHQIASENQLDI